MRILLADDDEDIRMLASIRLERRGWAVDTVASGQDASRALDDTSYDVLVLDQNMPPGGTGLEVAAAHRAGGRSTPIVLWTGLPLVDLVDTARDLDVTVLGKGDISRLPDVVADVARPH